MYTNFGCIGTQIFAVVNTNCCCIYKGADMSLITLIDKAIEAAGSQVKLAEMMGIKQQNVSGWRTGRRVCTTKTRIELCEIAGYDLKTALLEQVVEGLDTSNEAQADAAKTLNAVLAAFPKSGERIS
ncbi:YdaS family helix-turn-helix protein [Comamonas thiooxydans]|uniref:YdaS family helix-turn-helix protein n=1 Tax=Comamonas thiooxydans TaxID=363952 RepID=UPI001CD00D3F|nr:YdaS family helix-turn-helix protein [Comamonas thiooxydans]UBQ43079.1 helix-turn-helix domain-containing protein [Comamonas thiooxydans]